jgi:hypothetical protein
MINLSVQELGIGYIYLVLSTFQRAVNQFYIFHYYMTIESPLRSTDTVPIVKAKAEKICGH